MTDNQISSAVAQRDNGPSGLVQQYHGDFKTVLPSHVKGEAWVRIAEKALKRGKKIDAGPQRGKYELEVAAMNNPGVFLASLLDAARLGLEPGTEQYYLTPRKVKGQLEILGIIGWQGLVELMYRAGAVSSVIAECVFANDVFTFQPGRDEVPTHVIDWDSDDRGQLRLVYAYARMKDGATSKVIVLNALAIERIKKSSMGSGSEFSPWVQHPEAMWLKSAVRQLAKWTPTSAEYVLHNERARMEMRAEAISPQPSFAVDLPVDSRVDRSTGELFDSDRVFDGQVDDPTGGADPATDQAWPDVPEVKA